MKRWITGLFAMGLAWAIFSGIARAEYERNAMPSKTRAGSAARGDFDQAVDLARFRKGNIEWDTQELIKSGMTALHQEHLQILEELAELKEQLRRIEAQRR